MPAVVAAGLIALGVVARCRGVQRRLARRARAPRSVLQRTGRVLWVSAGLFAHMALIAMRRASSSPARCCSPAWRAASAAAASRRDLAIAARDHARHLSLLRQAAQRRPARRLACRRARRRRHLDGCLQRIDRGLRRRAAADEPAVGPARRHAGHRCRRAARRRPGAHRGDAAAAHRQARPDRRADHVRRHLLRRDVRRLDHHDPAQYAGRIGVHRDRAGRQQDGQGAAAPGRRSRPAPSARSSPAPSPPSCSRWSRRSWSSSRSSSAPPSISR